MHRLLYQSFALGGDQILLLLLAEAHCELLSLEHWVLDIDSLEKLALLRYRVLHLVPWLHLILISII